MEKAMDDLEVDHEVHMQEEAQEIKNEHSEPSENGSMDSGALKKESNTYVGKKRTQSQLNPIQNINDRYKKFVPLALQPMKHEFDDPEVLAKLNKTPVEEVKSRPEYSLGNYDSYYTYRCEKKWQDPRIKLLNKDYFLNKDCLDIGCNDGTLSIMIAIKYFPKSMIGVDIDYRLINKAIHNLR